MEKNEVSIHEAKLFVALAKNGTEWRTSKELAKVAGLNERTARAHCYKLAKLGLVDTAEVFPAHRYRMADKADKRNGGYVRRLRAACEVFGLSDEIPQA
jgi:DNA-binding CsgD family transcriptional regulator